MDGYQDNGVAREDRYGDLLLWVYHGLVSIIDIGSLEAVYSS